MAERGKRLPANASGAYYVDATCIDCDLCRQTAPGNFSRDVAGGYSFVSRQPSSRSEHAQCEHALQECPVESIGSDGEP